MLIAMLVAIGAAVCLAVQLSIRRYWFGLFLSLVATLVAWLVVNLLYARGTGLPLVPPGQWNGVEAVLGAALIAQCVARLLAFKRRMTGDA